MPDSRPTALSITFRVALTITLVAIGGGAYAVLKATKPSPARAPTLESRPRVNVLTARRVHVPRVWTGYGTARALDSADVPARVSATVVALGDAASEGLFVHAGDALVTLDDSDFLRRAEIAERAREDVAAQLEQLEIEARKWQKRQDLVAEAVALAQADYERAAEAQRREAVKEREVDRARQALIAAVRDEVGVEQELEAIPQRRFALIARAAGLEAELRLTRSDVARCAIVSPLDGVLQSVDVEIGESVVPGARVARVVGMQRIEIPLRVPAGARGRIRIGDAVELVAAGGDRWDASITRIAPEDDGSTRTMTAYAEVEQPLGEDGRPDRDHGAVLAPGRFVRGVVEEHDAPQRWALPRRAIDADRIRLVVDERVESRAIAIDFQVETALPGFGVPDRLWVILVGDGALEDGALVIVDASRQLVDGLQVAPVPAEADR